MSIFVSAIIAAAGRGLRFGGAQPKQFVTLGGRSVLERSVSLFTSHPQVDEIIVALPEDLLEPRPECLRGAPKPLRVVSGGTRRQDSVANALAVISGHADVVIVHDAARPFASADLVARTIEGASTWGAAVAAVQSRDTVKLGAREAEASSDPGATDGRRGARADADENERGRVPDAWVVRNTLPREAIFLAQTPQAFRPDLLREALSRGADATDEATLVERAGYPVRLVDGESMNIKITTPEDVPIAEAIAAARDGGHRPARTGRAGTGYDLHRLAPGRRLVLGGVEIPSDRGAVGHSDADVVCHAVTDAILGAAGLGDIGGHFPDSDPRWKDASSVDLLARVARLVAEDGLEVGNVDVTVVLEHPRIREHVSAMRRSIAAVLGIDASRVSIKGKTNEGVDAVGRGEAIAAHAIALLRSHGRT